MTSPTPGKGTAGTEQVASELLALPLLTSACVPLCKH